MDFRVLEVIARAKGDAMAGSAQQNAFWSIETDQLLTQLETTADGLTQSTAADRLSRATRLTPHRETAWSLLIDQFKSPIIILLFGSAILSFTLLDDKTN